MFPEFPLISVNPAIVITIIIRCITVACDFFLNIPETAPSIWVYV